MPVRARDIRRWIKELGFENGVVHTLEQMAEEQISHRQDMASLADIQSTVVESLERLNIIHEGVAKQLDEMRRREEQYNAVRSERIDPTSN